MVSSLLGLPHEAAKNKNAQTIWKKGDFHPFGHMKHNYCNKVQHYKTNQGVVVTIVNYSDYQHDHKHN